MKHKNRLKKRLLSVGCVAVVSALGTMALPPQSESLQSADAAGYLRRARCMMTDGNFIGVIDQLRHILTSSDPTLTPEMAEEAEFLLAKACYERGEHDCIDRLKQFVADYPASVNALPARLMTGDYYFFAGEYGAASLAYAQIELDALSSRQRLKYTYRKAYCLTRIGEFDQARKLFALLSDDKEYANAGRFYTAYIDYVEGDYQNALKGFNSVEREQGQIADAPMRKGKPRRQGVDYIPGGLDASCYVLQIEFRQGEYDRVASKGSRLLQSNLPEEMKPELNRIVGESYFKTDRADAAYPYLHTYLNSPDAVTHSAIYAMGAIEYERGRYDEAEKYFSRIIDNNDEISQSALLYLGQCSMKNGNPTDAAICFEKAYRMGYDSTVAETALFNYAVARTEGGRVPFASSAELLENFVDRYPDSKYAPQVDEYLATAYYNDRDYRKALASIERIASPSQSALNVKQKILYGLGVETLSNGDNAATIEYMSKAAAMTANDAELARQAQLWLAEALYNSGEYAKASAAYKEYVAKNPGNDPNRALALYGSGYSLYMQNDFDDACAELKKSVAASPALSSELKADALARMGDCRYYKAAFADARDYYAQALRENSSNADYAALQHAVMQGMLGKDTQKLSELNKMIADYGESKWMPRALLEKAATLSDLSRPKEVLATLETLVKNHGMTAEARRGMLQMALTQYELGKTDEAVETYKKVISTWPSSEESATACDYLAEIFASRGNLEEYSEFIASVPGAPKPDTDKIEKLFFDEAERRLGENADDIAQMRQYVAKYPDGHYLAPALYYIFDSRYATGNYSAALESAEMLLDKRGTSPYAPEALKTKAVILEKHIGNTPEALKTYKELEARGDMDYLPIALSGIMRTAPGADDRLEYADKVLTLSGVTTEEREEALFYRANALMQMNRSAEAIESLTALTQNVKSLYGSQAAVALGEYYVENKLWSNAEQTLSKFIDEGTPHSYWLARGYIALADTYDGQDKTYLAVEYIRSLKDNYPGNEPDIHDMINQRLNKWEK